MAAVNTMAIIIQPMTAHPQSQPQSAGSLINCQANPCGAAKAQKSTWPSVVSSWKIGLGPNELLYATWGPKTGCLYPGKCKNPVQQVAGPGNPERNAMPEWLGTRQVD